MSSSPMYAVINSVAFIANAFVVGTSTLGWWGKDNAEVSDENPTLVTPANWAFAIWGVIFFSEAVFTIWEALPIAWTFAFAQERLALSAALLLGIAACLAIAVVRLSEFKREELTIFSFQYWLVHFPIGLHGGWTLAASLVNINVALEDPTVSTEVTALLLTLVGAGIVAVFASTVFGDQVYLLAIAWALAAVSDETGYRTQILGAAVAQGVDDALAGLWIALLVVAVGSVVASRARMMKRREIIPPSYA
ncbi:unnamed protein product [Choristocarpus tenellus]